MVVNRLIVFLLSLVLYSVDIFSQVNEPWLLKPQKAKKAEKRMLMIGESAPDFSQKDSIGKVVKLSSFKGKYVLLDFWASWCGPCRQENSNLVNVYNKYKGKNFTIVGVTRDEEKNKDKWLKAVTEDGLTWLQLSDFDQSASRLYNATSLPANFLIDPVGKIVATNLRGQRLDKVLEEVLKDPR